MRGWLLQYQLQVHKSNNSGSLFNIAHYMVNPKEQTDIMFVCLNQVGIYLPCYDIFRDWLEGFTVENAPSATPYVPLVAGSLARSLACATCYPIELARTRMQVFKIIILMILTPNWVKVVAFGFLFTKCCACLRHSQYPSFESMSVGRLTCNSGFIFGFSDCSGWFQECMFLLFYLFHKCHCAKSMLPCFNLV